MSNLVLLEWHGPVAIVSLNRPERHNSLVPELLQQMLERLEQVARKREARAVLLRANGRSFSTGGDVRAFVERLDSGIEAYARQIVGLLNETILAMLDLPAPIVAAVHGRVTGGSIGLVLASDVVLVAEGASFRPYYSDVGLSPDGGWATLLPRIIGRQRAATVLMLNEAITAEQAVAWGLASRLVSPEGLHEEALATARLMAAKKAGSIKHTRQLLGRRAELEGALAEELRHFVQQIVTAEAQQGCRDFLARLEQRKVTG
jgi:2-(1,2-epoxy-1,2-dihydrophenyl)acetyl-CoA isomerase